ncbi:MAG: prolyl oligopeptidase family serine peptidase [Planctomycetaceae bacterium]
MRSICFRKTVLLLLLISFPETKAWSELPELMEFTTTSPLDQEVQNVRFWAPENANTAETPVLVFLHSWSGDYRQDNSKWFAQAVKRGWIFLHPDFRGVNNSPKACGSVFARQDILDAMAECRRRFRIDHKRVYLAGVSGGGHMSLLMAGHHANEFSAVSAWVGISDLAEWHSFHVRDGKPQRYAQMIEKSLSGPPGVSGERDADYRDRSPLFHLSRVGNLPVDIYAGVEDGHSGSVPVSHSLRAFNEIARIQNAELISESEIEQIRHSKRLAVPTPSDLRGIEDFGRTIHLHRTAGNASVTIFDGGHESLPEIACDRLASHQRAVPVTMPVINQQ